MGNSAETGGPLLPATPYPPDDTALDAIFQSLVANLTGLDGSLVRPRWQVSIPKQPEPQTDWCAIGILRVIQDDGPWLDYDATSNTTFYWDHEELELLASFYGPNSQSNARLLRAGLNVPQNTEVLIPSLIRYVTCGPIQNAPELVNETWIRRQDLPLFFRRKVILDYDIQNILISEVILKTDVGVTDTVIVPPGTIVQP